MHDSTTSHPKSDPSLRPLLRSMMLEIAFYIPVVAAYYWFILRFVGDKLAVLFQESLSLYSVAATLAIVIQGVLLEILTSWLVRRFGLRN